MESSKQLLERGLFVIDRFCELGKVGFIRRGGLLG